MYLTFFVFIKSIKICLNVYYPLVKFGKEIQGTFLWLHISSQKFIRYDTMVYLYLHYNFFN